MVKDFMFLSAHVIAIGHCVEFRSQGHSKVFAEGFSPVWGPRFDSGVVFETSTFRIIRKSRGHLVKVLIQRYLKVFRGYFLSVFGLCVASYFDSHHSGAVVFGRRGTKIWLRRSGPGCWVEAPAELLHMAWDPHGIHMGSTQVA